MGIAFGEVAGNDDIWDKRAASGDCMRRAILLAASFCASFCTLWVLLIRAQTVLSDHSAVCAALSVAYGVGADTAQQTTWALPFQVPGTSLIAEQIVLYEGPFLEDGSGREVCNTAALLVRNCGQLGIEEAEIVLEAGMIRFVFAADTIPAGQTVLVLEKSAKTYGPEIFSGCSGWALYSHQDWNGGGMLTVTEVDMGTLLVTNCSDKVLRNICLYYKNYLEDPGFYVGGRTNSYVIDSLQPGQTMQIKPNNYAYKYSGIVRLTHHNSL